VGGKLEGFWSYACSLYAKSGIESQLLLLQNDHGLVINHLLLACWLSSERVSINWCSLLSSENSFGLVSDLIEPMRDYRIAQKSRVPETLYSSLKRLELDLEYQHIQWLEIFAQRSSESGGEEPKLSLDTADIGLLERNLTAYLEAIISEGRFSEGFDRVSCDSALKAFISSVEG